MNEKKYFGNVFGLIKIYTVYPFNCVSTFKVIIFKSIVQIKILFTGAPTFFVVSLPLHLTMGLHKIHTLPNEIHCWPYLLLCVNGCQTNPTNLILLVSRLFLESGYVKLIYSRAGTKVGKQPLKVRTCSFCQCCSYLDWL